MHLKAVGVRGCRPTVIPSASNAPWHDPIFPSGSIARESLGFRTHSGDSGPSLPQTARGISAWSPNRLVISASCPASRCRATG